VKISKRLFDKAHKNQLLNQLQKFVVSQRKMAFPARTDLPEQQGRI